MRHRQPLGGIIHTYQKYDPQELPQPDAAAARPGLRRLRAHAGLRQPARADRRGTGPRRAPRSQPDRRAGAEPRSADARCSGSGSGRSWRPTRPTRVQAEAAAALSRATASSMRAAQAAAANASTGRFSDEQLHDLERLWYRAGDERSAFAAAVGAAGRPAGRQVPGRRAGRQVRVHRPHADDHPQGPGDQGRAGDDRPAAQAAGRGGQDGADRRDRHGRAGRVRRAGRHRAAQRAAAADRGVPARAGRAAGPGKHGQRLPAHAQGLPAVPGQAAGADLQQPAGLAHRPAPGAGRRRRGRRAAADQALRVRRLAHATWTFPAR